MRFRTYEEATGFIKALLKAKEDGSREFMTAKLDNEPAWSGEKRSLALKPWEPTGSRIEAVYMSYRKATKKQKDQSKPAKLAGVELEVIQGRLVDVRKCSDGTVQVLFVSGLRNAGDMPAWRGPNVDKGILCYLSIDEGIGEPVPDILARVPQVMKDELKEMKEGKVKSTVQASTKAEVEKQLEKPEPVAVAVKRGTNIIDVPAKDGPDENRMKLK